MGKLTESDKEKLVGLLSSTLSLDDLENYLEWSTGDRLYDTIVGSRETKSKTISLLLEALEQAGTIQTFLAYVYAQRPGRQDVRDEIARLFPAVAGLPDGQVGLSAPLARAAQPGTPANAGAGGAR
jgi:hypothetical protein